MSVFLSIQTVGDPESAGGVYDAVQRFQIQYPNQAALQLTNGDVTWLNTNGGAVDPTIFTNLVTYIGTYGMVILNLVTADADISNT